MDQTALPFSVDRLQQNLDTTFIGRHVYYFAQTTSTQDEAKEAALAGAAEGDVYLADEQLAGRGRLGRRWEAPARSSVLLTVVLRPPTPVYAKLFMVASLATAEAIQHTTGLVTAIKWPNDALLNEKKAAGVLVEGEFEGETPLFALVGLGVNVNAAPQGPGLLYPATSLAAEFGAPVDREQLTRELLGSLERWYQEARTGGPVHEAWRERLITLGKPVTARIGDETLSGTAEDVDGDGRLLLRLSDGALVPLVAGDVSLQA